MPVVIEMRHVEVPPFEAVEVSAGLEATVTAGPAQRINVSAPDSDSADPVELEVRGRTLHVGYRHGGVGVGWFGHRRASVAITTPAIIGISAGSGADVHATLAPTPELALEAAAGAHMDCVGIDSERLTARAGSGASLTLAGRCDIAELAASGGAAVDANGLAAGRIAIESSGGSQVNAGAEDRAHVSASSGASVRLRNEPAHLDQQSSGGASIRVG